MPIPLLLGGLIGSAVLGLGAHLNAQETNEKAQQIANEAKRLYNDSKCSLKKAEKRTQNSLMALETTKKQVLNSSIAKFMIAYNRVKNAELDDSNDIDELKDFMIDKQGVLQLKEMSDIYESTSCDVTSAAACITSGLAGSAFALGAAVTPFAAIAAPVMLFSGIGADMQADENLEKAKTMYAEAEAAAEKMKTSQTLCNAIAKKADMFNDLLLDLDERFSYCTALLDDVTKNKMDSNGKVDAKKLTAEEKVLLATTRALAGAVKSLIVTPVRSKSGKTVSSTSHRIYKATADKLPAFAESVDKVKKINYI